MDIGVYLAVTAGISLMVLATISLMRKKTRPALEQKEVQDPDPLSDFSETP
ncbi:MAG: hypothetical protein LBR42_00565 [Candidatus Methanoplasma sp.]|jgi:hypothetical protein|nr:hypothetical protein [Candidatus Methanoplasma sp.]